VDARELARPGPSYTYDTLSSLRADLGRVSLCLILGSDAFAALATWHRWRELIELAHMVVVQRPGAPPLAQGEVAEILSRHYVEGPAPLHRSPAGCVLHWPVTQLAISATDIRAMIAAGRSPRYLVPDSVWDLIKRDAIYRANAVSIPSSTGW
jgi:nicotinate-nucleotide adenylyltransferase